MSAKRLVAIGLDAADGDLIRSMIGDGRLPTFARLTNTAPMLSLRNCTEISSGATWPSVITGVNPGRHGMAYYARQLESGTYHLRRKRATEMAIEPFWHELDRRGRSTMVGDVPCSFLSRHFEGDILVGWGTEGLNAHVGSQPRKMYREVARAFGKHPLNDWYQNSPRDVAGWRHLLGQLVAAVQTRNRLYRWLLKRKRVDLFLAAYPEPHWVGHFFWFLRCPEHPRYDPVLVKEFSNAIESIYTLIDEGIDLLSDCLDGAELMIFSNTGIGVNYSGQHLVQPILDRTGLGVTDSSPRSSEWLSGIKPQNRWGNTAARRVEELLGIRTLSLAKRLVPAEFWDSATQRFLNWGHNWQHSKAFVVPNDQAAAVRINLKGREPNGRVEAGDEFLSVYEQIRETLFSAVNPDTGNSPVEDVVLVREHYHGDRLDELPDIIVKWKNDAEVRALESPLFGRVDGQLPDVRSGAHTQTGFLIGTDPRFESVDHSANYQLEDVAPTIFRCLGEESSAAFDGRGII